jgi:hypothetical protein
VLVLVASAALSCGTSAFLCGQDDDCDGAAGGQCVQGYCAFPDEQCESGLRFAEHSGGLSGRCVDELDTDPTSIGTESGTSSGPTDPSSTSLTSPTSPTSATSSDSSDDGATTDAPGGPVEFRDDEMTEFDAGAHDGTTHDGTRLRMAPGTPQGTFTSRVFDAGATVDWQALTWEPDGPYGKPLPDGGLAEFGYASGNVDMSGNVLLYHFEGDLSVGLVSDASGRGNDGVMVGDAQAAGVPGVFGHALEDPLDSYVSLAPPPDDLSFGVQDFTWAIWFRFDHGCATNNVFLGVDDVVGGADDHPHLWLGCTVGDWCDTEGPVPRLAAVLRSQHAGETDGVNVCGPGPVNDAVWHHAGIVKLGHEQSEVRLYLDGLRVETVMGTFAAPIDLTQGGDFAYGGFTSGTYPTQGTFDDAAIWTRALEDEEMLALWRRGWLQARLEVRVCEQAECADAPAFAGGPELVAGEWFSDPSDALAPGSELSIAGLPEGRYAQYRVTLFGSLEASPALASVTMRGVYR